MQDDAGKFTLEGVVVKVRKAARTLAFLSVRVDTPGLAPGAAGDEGEARQQIVQAVLEHEAGWRWACGDDGRRLCCGAVLSLWGYPERGTAPGGVLSVVVRGGRVQSSPHDSTSAAGGVKQHAEVERAAAAAAAGTAHRVRADAGTCAQQRRGPSLSRSTLPLCKQWWKARVDGTACVCATPSHASQGDAHGGDAAEVGACGRRHCFADADEAAKYGRLAEKRRHAQEQELASIADDPHAASSKQYRHVCRLTSVLKFEGL